MQRNEFLQDSCDQDHIAYDDSVSNMVLKKK